MRITIESTEEVVDLAGVPCRMWRGLTAGGVECRVFVHRVVPERGSEGEFDRELKPLGVSEAGSPVDDLLRREMPVIHRTFDVRHVL